MELREKEINLKPLLVVILIVLALYTPVELILMSFVSAITWATYQAVLRTKND